MVNKIFVLSILNVFFSYNNFNALYNDAVQNYYENNFTQSKKIFEKIIEANDANLKAEAYFYLGNIKFKEKKFLEAIAQYKNALRLNSEIYEAKYNLVLARTKLYENEKNKNEQNNSNQNNATQLIDEILNEAKQLENNAIKKTNAKNQNQNNYIKNW